MSAPGFAWQTCLKKTGVELKLLTDFDKLLIVEEGIRDCICYAIHRYDKTSNKYMKDYEKNPISSYLEYLDADNLYGWGMSQKLPIKGFIRVKNLLKLNEDFIKNYDENSNKGYFLELEDEYPKYPFNLHKDLPFLPERKKIEKCYELVCNIQDKENYVLHIKTIKQALNRVLIF